MKMTKRCLALVLALLLAMGAVGALAAVKIDKTNFPDAVFRKYVKEYFDANGDGKLTAREINEVDYIGLYDLAVKDLKGIEYFTKLESFGCAGTKLKKVDLSKNTRLVNVDLDRNKSLTSVKLGKLKRLGLIIATDLPKLKSLDVGGCPILRKAVVKQFTDASADYACYGLTDDRPIVTADIKLTLKIGSKVLRKYGKPTAIALNKQSVTVRKGSEIYGLMELGVIIKTTPATAVYPVKITSSDSSIIEINEGGWFVAKKKGEATLTVSCGKAKATLKVTVQ